MGKGQADRVTVIIRIRTIQEWLMQGHATKDIIQQGTTMWAPISDRQINRYLTEARKWFMAETKEEIESRRAFHVQTRMRLFKNLKNKDNPGGASAAMQILKDVAEIEGLYVRKIQHTGANGEPLIPTDPLKVSENKLIISVVNATDSNIIATAAESTDES